jgi:hypothetical protein
MRGYTKPTSAPSPLNPREAPDNPGFQDTIPSTS